MGRVRATFPPRIIFCEPRITDLRETLLPVSCGIGGQIMGGSVGQAGAGTYCLDIFSLDLFWRHYFALLGRS